MHFFGAIKRIAQPREEIYQIGDFLLILVWAVLWAKPISIDSSIVHCLIDFMQCRAKEGKECTPGIMPPLDSLT